MTQCIDMTYNVLNLKRKVVFNGSYNECVNFISDNNISDSYNYTIIPNTTYNVLDLKFEEVFSGSYMECVDFISNKNILTSYNYTILPNKK